MKARSSGSKRKSEAAAPGRPAPAAHPAGLMATGFILGMLLWTGADLLLGNPLHLAFWDYCGPMAGVLAALLNLSRARVVLWVAGGLTCAGLFLVAGTPIIAPAARSLVRSEPLQHADAVVVLSADIQADGDPSSVAQERILHGLEVLRGGYAPRLVLTRLAFRDQSYVPAVQALMDRLDFRYPIVETGRVRNTRDEALAVARVLAEHGWRRVILVSSPTHMRRSVAVFEKAGVPVIPSPCVERQFDLETLDNPRDRLLALRTWFHEAVGYEVYRRRGWL